MFEVIQVIWAETCGSSLQVFVHIILFNVQKNVITQKIPRYSIPTEQGYGLIYILCNHYIAVLLSNS